MKYLFKTDATMKEYNCEKWYIDKDFIKDKIIIADTPRQALEKYIEEINKEHYDIVSKNAIKNKSPIYRDTKDGAQQVGFNITASMEFDKGDYRGWSKQFFELWIEMFELKNIDFEEEF